MALSAKALINITTWRRLVRGLYQENRWVEKLQKGEDVHIDETTSKLLIAGFRKFYDDRNPKYADVLSAKRVTYELNATRNDGVFCLHDDENKKTTVSYKCDRLKPSFIVKQAFRGAIHCDQILPMKRSIDNTEVDHCNKGGFRGLVEGFKIEKNLSDEDLVKFVKKQDVQKTSSVRDGFYTFEEPILTEWRNYHREKAELQELSREEHAKITHERRTDSSAH
jgi:hypothetical protein